MTRCRAVGERDLDPPARRAALASRHTNVGASKSGGKIEPSSRVVDGDAARRPRPHAAPGPRRGDRNRGDDRPLLEQEGRARRARAKPAPGSPHPGTASVSSNEPPDLRIDRTIRDDRIVRPVLVSARPPARGLTNRCSAAPAQRPRRGLFAGRVRGRLARGHVEPRHERVHLFGPERPPVGRTQGRAAERRGPRLDHPAGGPRPTASRATPGSPAAAGRGCRRSARRRGLARRGTSRSAHEEPVPLRLDAPRARRRGTPPVSRPRARRRPAGGSPRRASATPRAPRACSAVTSRPAFAFRAGRLSTYAASASASARARPRSGSSVPGFHRCGLISQRPSSPASAARALPFSSGPT